MGLLTGCPHTDHPEPEPPRAPASLFQLEDINPTARLPARPSQVVTAGGTTFFTASDTSVGVELWKTDGTEAGTVLVKDLLPGPRSSFPFSLTSRDGTLFFLAQKPAGKYELWKSDGTEAGTVLVKGELASASGLENLGGKLYLRSFSSAYNGTILWQSDGTPEGSRQVAVFGGFQSENAYRQTDLKGLAGIDDGTVFLDVLRSDRYASGTLRQRELWLLRDGVRTEDWARLPLSDAASGSGLAVAGNTLFYRGLSNGRVALWKTDGTRAGTVQVKDVEPSVLAVASGTLFFGVDAGTAGVELWKSDGTEEGTVRLKSFTRGALPSQLTAVGGMLFFEVDVGTAGVELWRSDGTEAGTVWLKSFPQGASPSELTAVGGTLFFRVDDGTTGMEPWKSDGTEAGTVRVRDIAPGAASSEPSSLSNGHGTLFFTAHDGASGPGLWKSDGTEAGTVRVRAFPWPTNDAFVPVWGSAFSQPRARVNGTLFFAANDGVTGLELWKSDGTEGGTARVMDVTPGAASTLFTEMGASKRMLFFSTYTADHLLWASDGTEAGTALVGSDLNWFRPMDGGAVFHTDFTSNLWWTDGTTPGTVLLLPGGPAMQPMDSIDGTLLLGGTTRSGNIAELWRTDGTAAGTVRVKTFSANSFFAGHVRRTSEKAVLFLFYDQDTGAELWRTDGTEAGTVRLKDLQPGKESSFFPTSYRPMIDAEGTVFFMLLGQNGEQMLWRTDGTEAGTVRLATMKSVYAPGAFLAVGGRIFFWIRSQSWDTQLWTSDGTEAGTIQLRSFTLGTPTDLLPVVREGTVFFGADDGVAGQEPWRSDGTVEGTVRMKDLVPGPEGSMAIPMITWEGRIALGASTPDNPLTPRLWLSDGTEEGTVLMHEDGTGRTPYEPSDFVQVGSRLLFRASTVEGGHELWGMERLP